MSLHWRDPGHRGKVGGVKTVRKGMRVGAGLEVATLHLPQEVRLRQTTRARVRVVNAYTLSAQSS